ncbi:hypothetical protein F2Q69_00038652 [Brassica cretica]|uniref:Uncharacterized protein n=1 Tax=Brassica cretica TaxID=69181 RepID=A0A8S9SCF1_BRACR|nr:hypothetical protein F2Q69_00038652 [Brassica cretica]
MEMPLQGTSMHGGLRSQDKGDATTRDKHLADATPKCFRDKFYQLARNSLAKLDSLLDSRLSRKGEIESETNSIDRAIANLTYNKMESNISNLHLLERVQ